MVNVCDAQVTFKLDGVERSGVFVEEHDEPGNYTIVHRRTDGVGNATTFVVHESKGIGESSSNFHQFGCDERARTCALQMHSDPFNMLQVVENRIAGARGAPLQCIACADGELARANGCAPRTPARASRALIAESTGEHANRSQSASLRPRRRRCALKRFGDASCGFQAFARELSSARRASACFRMFPRVSTRFGSISVRFHQFRPISARFGPAFKKITVC